MPGMGFWGPRNPQDSGPALGAYPLGTSKTFYNGDVVVLTTLAGDGGPTPVVRPLSAADLVALYATAALDVCGILGIAPANMKTNTSGYADGVVTPVSVASGVAPIYALPNLAAGNALAGDQTRSQANILLATDDNILSGVLWENTTVTMALKGTAVGILRSTISSVVTFFWSTAAAVKIGRIVAISETDPLFNTAVTANVQDTTHYPRCKIGVAVLPDYQQSRTLFNYAT